MRSGELLVRRGLIESGLHLMISRSLVRRDVRNDGIYYLADDSASSFIDNLQSPYIASLRDRARWVALTFDSLSDSELDVVVRRLFDLWNIEFAPEQSWLQLDASR
jgi:hypothetical protein